MRASISAPQLSEQRVFAITLSTRHLVLGLFSAFALFIMLGGVGLVLARSILPSLLSRNEATPQEQVLVVDAPTVERAVADVQLIRPSGMTAVPETPLPAGAVQLVKAPEATVLKAPVKSPSSLSEPGAEQVPVIEPQPGQLFLQALSTTRAIANVNAKGIISAGLSCQIARGTDENSYRVLVGPIEQKEQAQDVRARLEQLGFQPFPRKY